jgi:hypothetical protein
MSTTLPLDLFAIVTKPDAIEPALVLEAGTEAVVAPFEEYWYISHDWAGVPFSFHIWMFAPSAVFAPERSST